MTFIQKKKSYDRNDILQLDPVPAPLRVMKPMFQLQTYRHSYVWLPTLWLTLFFVIPFFLLLRISLSEGRRGRPPYESIVNSEFGVLQIRLAYNNYFNLLTDFSFWEGLGQTFLMSLLVTILALLFSFACIFVVQGFKPKHRIYVLIFLLLPSGLPYIVRTLSMMNVLNLPFIELRYTFVGVMLSMTMIYFPFMFFPVYAAYSKLPVYFKEAAEDLGSPRRITLLKIQLPLIKAGILTGCIFVFVPVLGEYIIPKVIGGASFQTLSVRLMDEFSSVGGWPIAAAITILLLVFMAVPFIFLQRLLKTQSQY